MISPPWLKIVKVSRRKYFFCRQSRLRLIWKSEFLLQAANGQNPRKETLGYQHDSKAFLFSLVNKPGWEPVKLPQKGKYSSRKYSVQNLKSRGQSFGEHDMHPSSLASKRKLFIFQNEVEIMTLWCSMFLRRKQDGRSVRSVRPFYFQL